MDDVAQERNRLRRLMLSHFNEFKGIVLGAWRTIPVSKSPRDLMEEYLMRKFGPQYRPEQPRTGWPRRVTDSTVVLPRPPDESRREAPNTSRSDRVD